MIETDKIREKIARDFHEVRFKEFSKKFNDNESQYIIPYHVWFSKGEIVAVALLNGPGENRFYMYNPAKIFGELG
jgi:hypothetical protein